MVKFRKVSASELAKFPRASRRRSQDRGSARRLRNFALRGQWESVRLEAEVLLKQEPGDPVANRYLYDAKERLTGKAQSTRSIKITPMTHSRLINRAWERVDLLMDSDEQYRTAQADLDKTKTRRDVVVVVFIFLAAAAVLLFQSVGWFLASVPAAIAGLTWWLLVGEEAACRRRMFERREQLCDELVLDLALERDLKNQDAEGFYSSAEWRALRQQVLDAGPKECGECGIPVEGWDASVDHILPRSRFPHLSLERSNLQILCRSCNSAKSDRLDEE